jgi:hypothetical protein
VTSCVTGYDRLCRALQMSMRTMPTLNEQERRDDKPREQSAGQGKNLDPPRHSRMRPIDRFLVAFRQSRSSLQVDRSFGCALNE